jgi:hypothetical protein
VEQVDQVVVEMVGEFHLIQVQELQTLAVVAVEGLTLQECHQVLKPLETVVQV